VAGDGTSNQLLYTTAEAAGVWDLPGCRLGPTDMRVVGGRLSGNQPRQLVSSGLSLVLEGEIYNAAELRNRVGPALPVGSTSDVGLLLHLYRKDGPQFVDRLEGMFALALWDAYDHRLVLARDRMGIKPLYYTLSHSGICFGSETGCLVTRRSRLRPTAVAAYLRVGFVPNQYTIWSDIYELLPGRRLVWERGRSSVCPFAPRSRTDGIVSLTDLAGAVRSAVGRQTAGEAPVGLLFSAGANSAVLAAAAVRYAPDMKACTVTLGRPGAEAGATADLARLLGMEHAMICISQQAALRSMDTIVAHMDQPIADAGTAWVLAHAVSDLGLEAVLNGTGGDQHFAARPRSIRIPWAAGGGRAGRASPGLLAHAELLRLWPDSADLPASHRGPSNPAVGSPSTVAADPPETAGVGLSRTLRVTEAMSAAAGIQIRLPLLDDLVVNVVRGRRLSGQPGFDRRDLLDAVDPRLVTLTARPPRPLVLPLASWFRGPWNCRVHDALSVLVRSDLGFDQRALKRLWRRFEQGGAGWRPIWALTVLGEWLATTRSKRVSP
jgi:asparagine synthase (glutamine-hydrolysing)